MGEHRFMAGFAFRAPGVPSLCHPAVPAVIAAALRLRRGPVPGCRCHPCSGDADAIPVPGCRCHPAAWGCQCCPCCPCCPRCWCRPHSRGAGAIPAALPVPTAGAFPTAWQCQCCSLCRCHPCFQCHRCPPWGSCMSVIPVFLPATLLGSAFSIPRGRW